MKVEMMAGEERRGRGRPPDFPGPRMAAIGRQRVLRELKARGTNLSRWCRERGYGFVELDRDEIVYTYKGGIRRESCGASAALHERQD